MAGFDIHVDAIELSVEAERFLVDDLHFWRSDFCGHPEGYPSYEPPHHFTLKPKSATDYRKAFNQLRDFFIKNSSAMRGYVEGEFFAFDKDLPDRPFNAEVLVPFGVLTTSLSPGAFRESEIHVTMSRDQSDSRVVKALLDMGLFTAYLPKDYGVGQVFTVQGTQQIITKLLPALIDYLKRAGGTVHCSVKEERVVGSWLSDSQLTLPPVVQKIVWR